MAAALGDGQRPEETLDLLEASLPFNCQHVVGQSRSGKLEPEHGDLHYLFTCESGCNSFRRNIPCWDFEEALRDDCGKREEGRFELFAGKGAVTRATLYFLLRYLGTVDGCYGERRLGMLLSWHAAKPMDEWERHRNAVACELQGNRNPFVDFPDLAVKLF
jgi:endonuclease I